MKQEEIKEKFQAWKEMFDATLKRIDVPIVVMDDTRMQLFLSGYEPVFAAITAKIMRDEMGGEDGHPPYDEGAEIPKDTRVVRVRREHGDYGGIGDKGITVGFRNMKGLPMYFVKWDGVDAFINVVSPDKIKPDV